MATGQCSSTAAFASFHDFFVPKPGFRHTEGIMKPSQRHVADFDELEPLGVVGRAAHLPNI